MSSRVLVAVGTGYVIANPAAVPQGGTVLAEFGSPRSAAGSVTPTVPIHLSSHGNVSFYVNGAWLMPFTKDDSPQGS